MDIRITGASALEHLELLYSLNGIAKVASGDYLVACENGWMTNTPEEASESLANDLRDVDLIRARICEIGVGGFRLPLPELAIGDRMVCFREKNEDDEPLAVIDLKDGSHIELLHREFALDLEEQYFMLTHVSESGTKIFKCKGGLADIAPSFQKIADSCGIADTPEQFCPLCGAKVFLPGMHDGMQEIICSECGANSWLYKRGNLSITDRDGHFTSYVKSCRDDNKCVQTFLEMTFLDDCTIENLAFFETELDHPAAHADFRKYAAAGYRVAEKIYSKHCLDSVRKDCCELWEEAVKEVAI